MRSWVVSIVLGSAAALFVQKSNNMNKVGKVKIGQLGVRANDNYPGRSALGHKPDGPIS
jgi:hypothetical protein